MVIRGDSITDHITSMRTMKRLAGYRTYGTLLYLVPQYQSLILPTVHTLHAGLRHNACAKRDGLTNHSLVDDGIADLPYAAAPRTSS